MSRGVTKEIDLTTVNVVDKAIFDAYLTFCALGGIITSDTGKVEPMTQEAFCEAYNTNRRTLGRWKKLPVFGEMVRDRRREVFSLARETAAWNKLYLLGMQNQDKRAAVEALKTLLGHFGELQTPVQRQDVQIHGSATELLKAARDEGIIEGDVVYETAANADAGTDGQDPAALPLPS